MQILIGFTAYSSLKTQLRTMSSITDTSILDKVLVCFGKRIALALIQPAGRDKNYVASLHNEVVGIYYC